MERYSVEGETERLARCAHQRRVHYEVLPIEEVIAHRRMRVGILLRLWAVNEGREAVPTSTPAKKASAELTSLAQWLRTGTELDANCEIDPDDGALYPGLRGQEPDEVRVQLRILHLHNGLAPLGDGQARCLAGMKRKLKELGIRESSQAPP